MACTRWRIRPPWLAALFIAGAAAALGAHHSQSQFDPEKTVSIEGTLTRLSWRNPHTLFLLKGKRVGEVEAEQEWAVEGPSSNQVVASGWGSTVSKPGDKVTLSGRPRRDGKPELLLLSVTLADGKTISFRPD
ncbi:MAG: hypothetical protein HY655_06020 [Acidobacteria bacterium]|nr:hypothetical protein [Acidobacteriota bacterium]